MRAPIASRFVIALAMFTSLPAAANAAPACEVMNYKQVQAGPHVVVFEGAEGTTGLVNGNIVVVIGRDAILVVDSGQFAGSTRGVLEKIRALSPAPVRYVVNTHWHGDHLLANSVFKDAFPGAQIIAHSHTLAEANRVYTDYAERSATRLPQALADMKARLEATESDDERTFLQATLDCAGLALPEIKATRYVPPDRIVDDRLELDLGGVPVAIEHLGSGNTPGDLVVLVKPDRLVAAGDMVVHPAPYAIGSNLEPWPATLDKLMGMGAETYVPGHGPVFRNAEYIRDVQALLKETRQQLATLYDNKVTRQDAPAQVRADAFRQKYITTAMRRQAFQRFFIQPAVIKFWNDMDAKAKAAAESKPQ